MGSNMNWSQSTAERKFDLHEEDLLKRNDLKKNC